MPFPAHQTELSADPAAVMARAEPAPLLWLRRAALAAFVALAAWLAMRIVIGLLSPSSLWAPVALPAPATATTAARASYDFSSDPFSTGEVVAAPVRSVSVDAPETTLNLTLTGRRVGANGAAFIRTPDGQDDTFYVDQPVMNGVTLRGVLEDHVLLEVNGQLQRLTLEDAKLGVPGAQAATGTSRQLSALRTLDARTLMAQTQFLPATDEAGQQIGLYVRPRSSAVNLSDYGLRETDIVTHFAGQPLARGLPDAAAMARVAGSGRPIAVDIIRDGSPMTITIGAPS